jgi:DNA-binding MarR family transcriptional regulator
MPIGNQVELGGLSTHLGYLVRRAQLWVFKEVTRKLAAFEIGPAQYSVLMVVNANPGINQLAVSSALAIERAGLGRLIDRMVAQDLLMRIPSVVDRRSYVLNLTPAGSQMLTRIKPLVREFEASFAERLKPAKYDDLVRIFSTFIED